MDRARSFREKIKKNKLIACSLSRVTRLKICHVLDNGAVLSGAEQYFSRNLSEVYPASRGFSLVFLSVVLPFSSRFWLLAFCFGCFCAEEKTSADSRLGFLLSMCEMKMGLPWNFWVTCW